MDGDQPDDPDLTVSYWFGTQGYEFLDLGRFWQIYLFIGLLLWVLLMLRSLWPVLRVPGGRSSPIWYLSQTISIGLLFGAGLALWPAHTHLDHGILALVGGPSLG